MTRAKLLGGIDYQQLFLSDTQQEEIKKKAYFCNDICCYQGDVQEKKILEIIFIAEKAAFALTTFCHQDTCMFCAYILGAA